jgi:hypothetical protein
MVYGTGTLEDEASMIVEVDGIKLEIYAHRIDVEGWALCVINELGIMSNWLDIFETAQDALQAANRAIDTEGIEAFIDSEGFDYLLH